MEKELHVLTCLVQKDARIRVGKSLPCHYEFRRSGGSHPQNFPLEWAVVNNLILTECIELSVFWGYTEEVQNYVISPKGRVAVEAVKRVNI